MGNGGLVHLQVFADLGDIFLPVEEIKQDHDPCGISEDFKQFSQIDQLIFCHISDQMTVVALFNVVVFVGHNDSSFAKHISYRSYEYIIIC